MPNHAAHALLTIGAVLAALSSIHGASYTFTTIDVPDALSVSAFGINDRGQIVGSYLDASVRNHGFLWNEGVFSTIDFPGAITTVATGINARGQIVGTYDFFAPRTTAGFLWDQGVFTTIDVPGAFDTHLGGINARGQIVGFYGDGTGVAHGFLWEAGVFAALDVPDARQTLPRGINGLGQVAGYYVDAGFRVHGFLLDQGVFTTIDVPGASFSFASGINDRRQVVGGSDTQHGFLWDDGVFTTIDFPNASGTNVNGINNRGAIAGSYLSPGRTHGFVALLTDERPPTVTVSTIPTEVWPPNGKLATVAVSGTIADDSGGAGVNLGSAVYEVVDEYGQVQPRGSLTPGTDGRYAFTVALEASRLGNDRDGRHYAITVSATDNAGNRGSASTTVTVVHDQRSRP